MNDSTQRTWLITGAFRGLGKAYAEAALERRDLALRAQGAMTAGV